MWEIISVSILYIGLNRENSGESMKKNIDTLLYKHTLEPNRNILVTGNTGTGKKLFDKTKNTNPFIHRVSHKSKRKIFKAIEHGIKSKRKNHMTIAIFFLTNLPLFTFSIYNLIVAGSQIEKNLWLVSTVSVATIFLTSVITNFEK